ncbi:MAG: hypothetical protein WC828_02345 [Thermoleophilia bacterium]
MSDEQRAAFSVDAGTRHFAVTVYCDNLKIVGDTTFSMDTRSSVKQASDILASMSDENIILKSPRVFDRSTSLVIDEPPFIVVKMKHIVAMYAQEGEDGTA